MNLLVTSQAAASGIHVLDEDSDFARWQPEATQPHAYLVWGDLNGCVSKAGSMAAIAARLRSANSALVVVMRHDRGGSAMQGRPEIRLVRHEPPAAERIFLTRLGSVIPDEGQQHQLLLELSDLLPRHASPQDAVDLVEAVEQSTGLDRAKQARELATRRSHADAASLLADVRSCPRAWGALVSACVYQGLDLTTVETQADRLVARMKPDASPTERAPASFLDQLSAVGVNTDSTGSIVQPTSFLRSEAVLSQLAAEPDTFTEALTGWLVTAGRKPELISRAGRALALIVQPQYRGRGLHHLERYAASNHATSRRVAATALRHLAADPVSGPPWVNAMSNWAATESRWLRCSVALACTPDDYAVPAETAMPVLQRVARSLGTDPDPHVKRVLYFAVSRLFCAGDSRTVLGALADWSGEGRAERLVPAQLLGRLISDNLPWFETHLLDQTTLDLCARLVGGALRNRAPSDGLLTPLLAWSWCARWDPKPGRPLNVLLRALARDPHPRVQRFVSVVTRHGGRSPAPTGPSEAGGPTVDRAHRRQGEGSWL
ncbi:hypothetical protein ACWERV_07525 [Streptomyces sp. NPDC004031]